MSVNRRTFLSSSSLLALRPTGWVAPAVCRMGAVTIPLAGGGALVLLPRPAHAMPLALWAFTAFIAAVAKWGPEKLRSLEDETKWHARGWRLRAGEAYPLNDEPALSLVTSPTLKEAWRFDERIGSVQLSTQGDGRLRVSATGNRRNDDNALSPLEAYALRDTPLKYPASGLMRATPAQERALDAIWAMTEGGRFGTPEGRYYRDYTNADGSLRTRVSNGTVHEQPALLVPAPRAA